MNTPSELLLYQIDQNNKLIKEETIERHSSYEALKQYIIENFKINSFDMYYYDLNNKKVIITDNEQFKKSGGLIFIIDKKTTLDTSIYQIIYPNLSDSKANLADEKYNCPLCGEKFNDAPYYCYQCSKRICQNCLIKLNKKTDKLKCSYCSYEMPFEKWQTITDFKDEKKKNLELYAENMKLKDEIKIHFKKESEFLRIIKEERKKFQNTLKK